MSDNQSTIAKLVDVVREAIHPDYHCGPYNKMLESPLNPVDEMCYKHDEYYQDLLDCGLDPYWTFNEADANFINQADELVNQGYWRAALYAGPFKWKELLLPELGPNELNECNMVKGAKKHNQKPGKQRPKAKQAPRPRSNGQSIVTAPSARSTISYGSGAGDADRIYRLGEMVVSNIELSAIRAVRVNPACATFAVMHPEALRYSRYEFMSDLYLTFSPGIGTTAAGRIIAAWVPDPNTPMPTTVQQLLAMPYHYVGPVWRDFALRIPKERLSPGRSDYLIREGVSGRPTETEPGYFVYYTDAAADPGDLHMVGTYKFKGRCSTDDVVWKSYVPINSAVYRNPTDIPLTTAATNGLQVYLRSGYSATACPWIAAITTTAGTHNVAAFRFDAPGLYRVRATASGTGGTDDWVSINGETTTDDGVNWNNKGMMGGTEPTFYAATISAATRSYAGSADVLYVFSVGEVFTVNAAGPATATLGNLMIEITPVSTV